MTVPQETLDAAQKSVRAGYGVMADVLTGQIRYALEAAAPLIAAAERERIRQLALSEATKARASNFSVADPIGAGALEDFADLLTDG